MKVRHPMGVLHSFSIKNIFYVQMDLRLFYFDVAKLRNLFSLLYKNCCKNDAKEKPVDVFTDTCKERGIVR